MAKQNGNGQAPASELTELIANFEAAKAQAAEFDVQIATLKEQRNDAAARVKELGAKLKAALGLVNPKIAAMVAARKANATKRAADGFGIRALKLLADDGIAYSTSALVEEFGGTMGSAYQTLHGLHKQGKVSRNESGDWFATEAGKEAVA